MSVRYLVGLRNVVSSAAALLCNAAGLVAPALDRARFRALLGVGERRFVELLTAGIIDRPLDLGPRLARWHQADYERALKRLKRRAPDQEPDQLRGTRKGGTS